MLFHVTFEASETIISTDIPRFRRNVGSWLDPIVQTGHVKTYGMFDGRRGCFAVFEAESSDEVLAIIGDLAQSFKITINRIINPEILTQYFKKEPALFAFDAE